MKTLEITNEFIEKLIYEEKELLQKISENREMQRKYYTDVFCEKYKRY